MGISDRPRVVIVGGGFGGLWAARALAHAPAEVVLVDRNNYHTFLPLLYQVAAAELNPAEIAQPIRHLLRRAPNARFVMAEVMGIDFGCQVVETDGPSLSYDYLILAMGSRAHFFGVAGADAHAFPLKTMEQAIILRNHILCCFERASHEPAPDRQRRQRTFTIVGGGPTGVEFAGALAELIHGPLLKDYPDLRQGETQVLLLEAADSLLPGLPERLRAYADRRLRRMGVQVQLQTTVREIAPESVRLSDGTLIPTETVVWTAGVRGEVPAQSWGLPTSPGGRVAVLPTLQLPTDSQVYVVGDLAHVEEEGRSLPMVAPVATQQGVMAAQNIERQMAGQEPRAFGYRDRGTMATIGRNAAVAHLAGRDFTGFIAWVIWLAVHLYQLIGFRNRLMVLISWAWDYLFYERAVRLILPAPPMPSPGRCPPPAKEDRTEEVHPEIA